MVTDYRGPLIVNEQKEAQSNADNCRDVVGNEADEDDIEGGTPDPDSQEEQVAKQVEIDLSVSVGCVVGDD